MVGFASDWDNLVLQAGGAEGTARPSCQGLAGRTQCLSILQVERFLGPRCTAAAAEIASEAVDQQEPVVSRATPGRLRYARVHGEGWAVHCSLQGIVPAWRESALGHNLADNGLAGVARGQERSTGVQPAKNVLPVKGVNSQVDSERNL